MQGESGNVTVVLSPSALHSLDEIWEWNVSQFGVEHAHRYIAFLRTKTYQLEELPGLGRPVPKSDRFRYFLIRRRRKGHGHLAVYERVGDVIRVIRFYHSAQDWQKLLREEGW